jgi:hypothetical protein
VKRGRRKDMKTQTIECSACNTKFEKELKEITRQKKKGRTNFYCSLSCAGKAPRYNSWSSSKENKENLSKYSNNRADEYTGFREYMRRANKRNQVVDLDLPYLKELWELQDGRCAYTKVKLEHPTYTKSTERYNYMSSLDRIDNSKGYIKGNVQYVSVSVNWLKNKMDNNHLAEFFKIVSGVTGIDRLE